ncbi:MAG TPA: DUF3604 domain-containing protein [Myxococcota bacterium]|nr:DUF3604 domain-containing protein [Myxococcota bacterium]
MTAQRRLPALLLALGAFACGGGDLPPGEIEAAPRPAQLQRDREAAQHEARAAIFRDAPDAGAGERQILFGDLHVHTSWSIDSFVFQLPLFGSEGTHPPADACDYARWCSALDFFSINDHAEGLTPERWQGTKESIRQCNAVSGDPGDPDLVAFVGWEWTQAAARVEDHFGHKNVIYPGLDDAELPARPITALPDGTMGRAPGAGMKAVRVLNALPRLALSQYADFFWWVERMTHVPDCPVGVDARELPSDCRENAYTPDVLFEKLAQWDLPVLVIPHGMAWGIHAPPRATLATQLTAARHDPSMQRLLEVYSGHGNSEEWRDFEEPGFEDGEAVCPEPSEDYLPCCWRAGEIVRERCGDLPDDACEARVVEARRLAVEAGSEPHLVLPDTRPEDWLDCDQCRDCFKPAMNLRPKLSAQYALALSAEGEGEDGEPLRFRFGLVGSSDNHDARPGTGFKQVGRVDVTDARGFVSPTVDRLTRGWVMGTSDDPGRAQAPVRPARSLRALMDVERTASFLYPGGLVAVHAESRRREDIWSALMERRVYGTSGPRILLWFELENGPAGPLPMGSEVSLDRAPRFRVRAVGSFVQKPGCPHASVRGLPPERLERLCRGECNNPSDVRHRIEAIEIVRIRPQRSSDEPVDELIEDPWLRFECPDDPTGCTIAFDDPAFVRDGHDAVYYARVLQEPTPAINGANLRTEFDAEGNAVATTPCHGNWRTPASDDCHAPVQERAWSSPIFVDHARGVD